MKSPMMWAVVYNSLYNKQRACQLTTLCMDLLLFKLKHQILWIIDNPSRLDFYCSFLDVHPVQQNDGFILLEIQNN